MIVDVKVLRAALARVKPAVDTRRNAPMFASLARLDAEAGRLVVTVSDLDTTIRCGVAARGALAGVAVPFAALASVVRGGEGDLVLDVSGGCLVVTESDGSVHRIPVSGEPYPQAPDGRCGHPVASLPVESWRDLAAVVAFAGTDHLFPVLGCVQLSADAGGVTAVATDRFLLGVAEVAGHTSRVADLLVPAVRFALVPKLLSGVVDCHADSRALDGNDGFVSFCDADTVVTVRAEALQYPKWQGLMPRADSFLATASVDVVALSKAVRKVAPVCARDGSIVLRGDVSSVTVEATNEDSGASSLTPVAGVSVAGSVVQAYAPARLLRAVGAFTGVVSFGWRHPGQPTVVSSDGLALRVLLMPVRFDGQVGEVAA